MGQSDIEKRGEFAEHSAEMLQRLALSFMPGGNFIEEFLGFHSSLKQKRIIEFSESLRTALEEISGKEIDPACYTTEDFVDIFESVINKVQNTKSEYKLERFRNILVNRIAGTPIDTDVLMTYIQTINELNDFQLLLLDILRQSPSRTIYSIHDILSDRGVTVILDGITESSDYTDDNPRIDSEMLIYYLEELVNKRLIYEIEDTSGGEIPSSEEIKMAYSWFINRKTRLSNSRIIYVSSRYADKLVRYTDGLV